MKELPPFQSPESWECLWVFPAFFCFGQNKSPDISVRAGQGIITGKFGRIANCIFLKIGYNEGAGYPVLMRS